MWEKLCRRNHFSRSAVEKDASSCVSQLGYTAVPHIHQLSVVAVVQAHINLEFMEMVKHVCGIYNSWGNGAFHKGAGYKNTKSPRILSDLSVQALLECKLGRDEAINHLLLCSGALFRLPSGTMFAHFLYEASPQ